MLDFHLKERKSKVLSSFTEWIRKYTEGFIYLMAYL